MEQGVGKARSGEHGAESKKDAALAPCSTLHAPRSSSRIIRLRASRFGRGTFVGKLLDYASYYVGVAWKLSVLRPKPDRIVALTTPPLLSVLARLFSKIRGADHAHWVMDLYPDVMAAHGMLGENSVIYRILAGMARWGFGGRRRAAVLTLGPDMAERVKRVISKQSSVISKEEEAGGAVSNHQPSTPNSQLASNPSSRQSPEATPDQLPTSPVQWVPLWGTGGEGREHRTLNIEHQTSNIEHRRGEHADCSGESVTVTLVAIGVGDEDDVNDRDSLSTINSQPYAGSTSPLRHQRGWADGELIVMYSGNMGLGHRFGEILEAAGRANIEHRTPDIEHRSEEVADSVNSSLHGMNESRDESRAPGPSAGSSNQQLSTPNSQLSSPTRFVFFGGGKRRAEVEAFARENPDCAVEVHDYAPAEELAVHLQSADVHLASLDDAWTGTMVPSKLQGIFAAGRPVIFIGSVDSSIGRWVAESGGGWVVQAGDAAGLLAALDEARDPEIRLTRGRAARTFAETHFDKRTNVARVAAILAAKS